MKRENEILEQVLDVVLPCTVMILMMASKSTTVVTLANFAVFASYSILQPSIRFFLLDKVRSSYFGPKGKSQWFYAASAVIHTALAVGLTRLFI
jgi:hypothetical protein